MGVFGRIFCGPRIVSVNGVVGFFKGGTGVPYSLCTEMPPLVHCSSSVIISTLIKVYSRGRNFCSELFSVFLAVIEYALPFTEFYRRNDEYRIGGASRCFESFSNTCSLGESFRIILKKSQICIISTIFFLFFVYFLAG